MEQKRINDTLAVERFASLYDFSKNTLNRPLSPILEKYFPTIREKFSREAGNSEWAGTNTYEEAVELFRKGDIENLKIIGKEKKECGLITTKNTIERNKNVFSIAGAAPCVPKLLSDNPFCMRRKVKTKINAKKIVIYFDPAFSGRIDKDILHRNGSLFFQMLETLRLSGFIYELHILSPIKIEYRRKVKGIKHDILMLDVLAANSSNYTNKAVLAFVLCNPAFYRRIFFNWFETVPFYKRQTNNQFYLFNLGYKYLIEQKVINDNSIYITSRTLTTCKSVEDVLLTAGIKFD